MQARKEIERGCSADEARTARPAGGSAASTRPRTRTAISAGCRGSTRCSRTCATRGATMRRDVGFAVVALGTLAIGIGATTTIFSLLRGVLLAPLPYPEPDRLVRVYESTPGTPTFPVTPYSLLVYRHENRTLAGHRGLHPRRPSARDRRSARTAARPAGLEQLFRRPRSASGAWPAVHVGRGARATPTWPSSATRCGAIASTPIAASSAARCA